MAIRKFKKRPVVVEAVQYTDAESVGAIIDMQGNGQGILNTADGLMLYGRDGVSADSEHRVPKGDWVIKGVKGELYPCPADVFEATYDEVTG